MKQNIRKAFNKLNQSQAGKQKKRKKEKTAKTYSFNLSQLSIHFTNNFKAEDENPNSDSSSSKEYEKDEGPCIYDI